MSDDERRSPASSASNMDVGVSQGNDSVTIVKYTLARQGPGVLPGVWISELSCEPRGSQALCHF